MTPNELRAIRKGAAPGMTQAAFARLLGYENVDSYRRYETGLRPIPRPIQILMRMIDAHGVEALK